MGFADSLTGFARMAQQRVRDVHTITLLEAHRSIQSGSEITGAAGQPVDEGNLFRSWVAEHESPTVGTVSSNVEYAPVIEDNPRGVMFKNHGPHSVKQTVAGFPAIVAHANTLAGGG